MRKRIEKLMKWLVAATLLTTIILPTAVVMAEDTSSSEEAIQISEQVQSFAQGIRLLITEQADGNTLYSPFSYYLALLALEPGLTEDQQSLLDEVLTPEGVDRQAYLAVIGELLKHARENEELIFNTETYLLARDDLQWNTDYLESVNDLSINPSNVDFQNSETYEQLNEDIAMMTEGLIDPYFTDERIEKMTTNEALQLVLMNLLYFKGNWTKPFYEEGNTEEAFYGLDDETIVTMMHKEEKINYLETDDYQAIQLPYQNGASLWVILPQEATKVEDMWGMYEEALEQVEDFQRNELVLSLPKWESSGQLDLTETLVELGLGSFQKDLGPTQFFTEVEPTAISQILQRVEFILDEDGTRAAAVTEIDIETTSAPIEEVEPIELIINRPFIYGIVYEGIPLFEGLMLNIEE